MRIRSSGILLHITSLPSQYGIGDFGPEAYRFADLLALNKQSFWQVLPLSMTDPIYGNTPYDSMSAFAGNPLLISLEMLEKDGLISKNDLESHEPYTHGRVDYPSVTIYKKKLLDRAYEAFKGKSSNDTGSNSENESSNKNDNYQGDIRHDYERFISENSHWLDDFALFSAIKSHFQGKVWSEWPDELRDRKKEATQDMSGRLMDELNKQKFIQFIFFQQWFLLKRYCNSLGIQVIGDIPIYVNYDSADVWTRPDIFKLDGKKRPVFVAGVPPDYFSKTGQLWGNPIYRWGVLRKEGFAWWIRRMEHNLSLFDLLRIDHFRGLVAYWEVEAGRKDAVVGKWVKVPTEDFLTALFRRFPNMPVIAEDLGLITSDVREVISHFDLPGMKLLLFAFGEGVQRNPYAPHNHVKNCLVYTGTHDNNTARGWFEHEAKPDDRARLSKYLGHEITAENVSWELVRLAMMSVADVVILPMQDILGLGEEARMNRPSSRTGNYEWRLLPEQMKLDGNLRELTEIFGRT